MAEKREDSPPVLDCAHLIRYVIMDNSIEFLIALVVLVFVCSAPQLVGQTSDSDEYVTGMVLLGKPNAGASCPPIVWKTDPDTPAAKAGIQPGDRLLGIDGQRAVDILQASQLLHSHKPPNTVELEGKNGSYKVEVGRIKASEIYTKHGLKAGPDGMLFPSDATDVEMQRVSKIQSEPPREKKVFNVGHYPADLNLYYPGFEVFVWNEPQPMMVGGIESGPAERAGVHYGDAIISVNGVNPRGKSMAELGKLFSSDTPVNMRLVIDRDGVQKTFNFALEKASEVAALNGKRRYEGRMIPSAIPDAYLNCWSIQPPQKP
jgi:S1-C subfamily serine protease